MKSIYLWAILGLLACGDETQPVSKTNNKTTGQTTTNNGTTVVAEIGLDERPLNKNCIAPPRSPLDTTVELSPGETVSPEVKDFFQSSQGEYWYDVNAKGTVSRSKLGLERSTFLNIRARVYYVKDTELGLLGATVGPKNEFMYVHYTAGEAGNVTSVISRYPMGENVANRDAEEILLQIPQPMAHNNGGHLRFGPDGFLYIGMGDGGDPTGEFNLTAQKTDNLLGKILRIDPSQGNPYAIPPSNPFSGAGGEAEIFAIGFQNPTRLNFDKETGDLWVSDTGKRFQELNLVKPGGNYGWSIKVADGCAQICDPIAWQDPAFTHLTGPEDERIIGGSVYRGSKSPDLRGSFVYAERISGKIFGVFADTLGAPRSMEIATVPGGVTQIAQSRDGEMYFLGTEGELYEIRPTESNETLPLLLSETGCVDPSDATKIDSGMIPYKPVAPFFSDNADKERYFSIPDGTKVTIEPNGIWTLPPGSVTLKHFLRDDKIFETRFLVRHEDESYSGYTYRWEGNDAKLIRGSFQEDVGGEKWQFPSRAQCMACHTEGTGGVIGIESGQLDSLYTYESTGRTANQLDTLIEIGVAEKSVRVERLVDPFGEDPLDARARSYLHTNCASCHRADQEVKKLDFDLTYSGFFGGLCNEEPLYGEDGVGAKRLVPGDKEKSLLYRVLLERDANTMPPLGNNLVDDPGVALIGEWIDGLEGCP